VRPPTEQLDRRYGDKKSQTVPWTAAETRLTAAQIAWIVTVRPHATPMVPVVHDGKVHFHTGSTEVKYANLEANPHVLVLAGDTAWDDGLDVAVAGTAAPVTDDALLHRLAELYRERRDGRWKLDVRDGGLAAHVPGASPVMFEVTPDRAYGHDKGDPFGQTNYRY